MSKKSRYYHLKLTQKEFKAVGEVLDNYVMDCAVPSKTLAAVERVITKIIREEISHVGEAP
jgi:hypothetical protein